MGTCRDLRFVLKQIYLILRQSVLSRKECSPQIWSLLAV